MKKSLIWFFILHALSLTRPDPATIQEMQRRRTRRRVLRRLPEDEKHLRKR